MRQLTTAQLVPSRPSRRSSRLQAATKGRALSFSSHIPIPVSDLSFYLSLPRLPASQRHVFDHPYLVPMFNSMTPQGVPPSGIQWSQVLTKLKEAHYHKWRADQKRFKDKDTMPVGWTTLAYSVFLFCGPRGKDLSFLRVGSLDEDSDVDTSRAGAREEEKKAKIQEASEKESPTASTSLTRDQGRAALASSMDAQMLKLLIAHGDPAQKPAALLQLAAAVMPAPPAALPVATPVSLGRSLNVDDLTRANASNTIYLEQTPVPGSVTPHPAGSTQATPMAQQQPFGSVAQTLAAAAAADDDQVL